jgi:hypothetical protein
LLPSFASVQKPQSLVIDERLVALAPTNVMFQNDVSVRWRLVAEVRRRNNP